MTAGLRTGSIDIRSLAAVISMIAVVGLSFGLTLPLVSIILEDRGVPGSVIGANSAMPALALPLVIAWPVVLWPSLFVWGGVVAGLYTVGLTLLGERFRGPDLVGANAAFVMLYGPGALVGPPLSGSAMDIWNPHGFAAALTVICLAYLVLAALRQRQRRRA